MATTIEALAALFMVLVVVSVVFGTMTIGEGIVIIVLIAIVAVMMQKVLHISVPNLGLGGSDKDVSKA